MRILKTAVIISAISAGLSAQAQTSIRSQIVVPGYNAFQNHLHQLPQDVRRHLHFGVESHLHAQKTTGSITRVKAVAQKVYNGSAYVNQGDSTRVFWHLQQGGNFVYGDLIKKQVMPVLSQPEDPYMIPDSYDSSITQSTTLPGGLYNTTTAREIATLDANQNQLSVIYQLYAASTWTNDSRTLYAYNAAGKRTLVQNENWNNNAWEPSGKKEWQYDAQNRIISVTQFLWDNTNNVMYPTEKSIYTYDATGNLKTHKRQLSNGTTLVDADSVQMIYNAANNRTHEYVYNWNGTSWDTASRSIIAYNALGKLDSIVLENYAGSSQWSNFMVQDYVYDAAGALQEFSYKTWNGASFDNEFKLMYTFVGSNLTSFASATWDDVNNVWQYDIRQKMTYNAAGLVDALFSETWNGTSFAVAAGNDKAVIHYETILSVKDLTGHIAFTALPNPAHDAIQINTKDNMVAINLVNAQGQILQSIRPAKGEKTSHISVAQLASGTYYLQVQTTKGSGTKAVSVLR